MIKIDEIEIRINFIDGCKFKNIVELDDFCKLHLYSINYCNRKKEIKYFIKNGYRIGELENV